MSIIPNPRRHDGDDDIPRTGEFTPLDIASLRNYLSTDPQVVRPFPVDDITDDELDAAVARFDALDVPGSDDDTLYPQAGPDGEVHYFTGRQIRTASAAELASMMAASRVDYRPIVAAGGHRGDRVTSRTIHRVIVLPALLAFAAMVLGLGGTPAQAATSPAKGPGLTLKVGGKSYFVGPYVIGGHLLYCTDEGLQVGNGAVVQGAGPAKLNPEARARLAELVNAHGTVTTARDGARVKLAVATLVAPFDPAMRKVLPALMAQMTATDRAAIADMVAKAAIHAPYTARVVLDGAVPGQTGRAVVTVLGSNGKPAVGRTVAWTVNGATAVKAATKTDTTGRAVATFTAVGLGQSATATVTSPSSTAVWQNTPTAGHQLMVGGGYTDTVKASDVAEVCPITLTVTKTCPCKGQASWTYRYTFSSIDLPGAYRVWVQVNGTTVKAADLGQGQDVTLTVQVPAGASVTARYSVVDANGTALLTDTLDSVTQG